MKLSPLPFTLLLFSIGAAAQEAPQLHTFVPSTVPTTGGMEVEITGAHLDLPPGFACIDVCPPVVRFGTHEVKAHEWTDTRVVVKSPPHPAGPVDITLTTGDGRSTSKPAAVTYAASPEETWESVLVPVYLDDITPGANGSQWQTEFAMHNGGSTGVQIAPWPCPENQPCPPVFPSQRSLSPGESVNALPRPATRSANPGRLLFLSDAGAADVAFGLRVRDASRSVTTAGDEIPIVRESEFRTKPVQLLNVPWDPAVFRYSLRIYDVARVPTRFVVRVYDDKGSLGEVHVTTFLTDPSPLFPFEPAFTTVDITQAMILERAARSLRVEVEPLDPYSRFWAMLTVTSSVTSDVSLITPQ